MARWGELSRWLRACGTGRASLPGGVAWVLTVGQPGSPSAQGPVGPRVSALDPVGGTISDDAVGGRNGGTVYPRNHGVSYIFLQSPLKLTSLENLRF